MSHPYYKMAGPRQNRPSSANSDMSAKVILSYVLDWVVLLVFAVVAGVFSIIEPNKRPFSLDDPDIAFPMTEHEACPLWLLLVLVLLVPAGVIVVVVVVFVPGATVPRNTPASLVWKRKLWELHTGWLGLALSLVTSFFLTQGLKNMFGKPRPDLLARCMPDTGNAHRYATGGFGVDTTLTRLYTAGICQQPDSSILDDGFRSYPSGHASSAAAGLVYLTFFLASKFSVTAPFAVPGSGSAAAGASPGSVAHEAFPSRSDVDREASEPLHNGNGYVAAAVLEDTHNARLRSVRRQAAAPPLYLFAIVLVPFCASLWIAASRWYDFRHHGFDLISGYVLGVIPAYYSFRYYHMPIHQGAGWAWGPRSSDRAFWAGVGHLGYVDDSDRRRPPPADAYKGTSPIPMDVESSSRPGYPGPSHQVSRRPVDGSYSGGGYGNGGYANSGGDFQDVEMERMNNRI